MQWLLLGVLGIVLIILLYKIFQKLSKASSKSSSESSSEPVDLSKLQITDAKPGDLISISGAGDDCEDLQFTVDRRSRYESGGNEWFELGGVYRGQRVFVEYYEDDEIEVSTKLDPRKLTLQDLGVTEDVLKRMDEEQRRSNTVDYDGQMWSYRCSQEVGYMKEGHGEGEGFYSWEFESKDGESLLFIEKWEGESFEAGIARCIHPDDISVFRA